MVCGRCEKGEARHSTAMWLTLGLIGAAIEAAAVKKGNHNHTLSHTVRSLFRTNTPAGRLTFGLAWSTLFLWFLDHVIRSPHNHR